MATLKEASNEEILAECVDRGLMSASTAVRMLRLSSRDFNLEADLWIMSNLDLFHQMEREAAKLAGLGKKFGAKLLAEQARWNNRNKGSKGGFKINNYLVTYLARRMVERNPKLAPFIKMRKTRNGNGMASPSGRDAAPAPAPGR